METRTENKVVKPCHILKACPYGALVEQFPLLDEYTEETGLERCSVFGHQCPYNYVANERVMDDGKNIWRLLNTELKNYREHMKGVV